ncbi:MAG: efflux RND transporter permease subunit [Leptospiraceae bacterium]|nr:efflux RND transporter permease subunit [Leptospiraceae bacterium]
MRTFIDYFLDRGLFVNLLTFILIVVGGFIAMTMNKEAFPNIDFDIVSISTIYPGASPEEVEKLVTNPIEDMIKEVDGIKEFRSGSLENRSGIIITIDPDVEDTSKVVDDIRSAIDRAEDLPDDAEEPIITEISTARQPVIQWSLQRLKDKDGNYVISYSELREYSRRLENLFLNEGGVARVERQGWRDAEIFVDVNPDLLNRYYIGTDTIVNTLASRNVNFPGGEMKQNGEEVAVRTIGEYEGVREIMRTPLRSNDVGQSVPVAAVAQVREDFAEPEILETTLGRDAVNLTVVKRQSADIIDVVDSSKRIVQEFAPYTVVMHFSRKGHSGTELQSSFETPLRELLCIPVEEPGFKERLQALFAPDYGVILKEFKAEEDNLAVTFVMDASTIANEDLDDSLQVYKERDQEIRETVLAWLKQNHSEMQVRFDSHPGIQGVAIHHLNDMSFFVRRRLGILANNGAFGLILVVGSLFFFMGWRTSLMVAMGIPTAMGIAFMVMSYLGVTLNLISMFGLILVIGILVDDAIIVSENFYRYYEEGMDVYTAASKGASEVIPPVVATISTSVAAFGPMMFMSGIFGKFIYTIPLVVIIALLASLFECFVILPSHLREVNLLAGGDTTNETNEQGGHWFQQFRDSVFTPAMRWGLHHRWIAVGVLVALFFVSVAMIPLGLVGFKLFPSAIETLHVKFTTPTGTTKEETLRYIEAFEQELDKLPTTELKNYSSRSGITQKPSGNDPFTRRGSNYGQTVVYLTLEQDRDVSTADIVTKLRNRTEWLLGPKALKLKKEQDAEVIERLKAKGDTDTLALYENVKIEIPERYRDLKGKMENLEIEMLQGGPPVGKPIAIEIIGDNFGEMNQIANEYKAVMKNINGIVDIDDDFLDGKNELQLDINEELASQAGVSVLQIAQAVNTAFEGTEATSIRRPQEEVIIRVRFAEQFRNSTDALKKLFVTNRQGQLIPVSKMIRIHEARGVIAINHLDGRRLMTVTANVDEKKGMSSAKATALVQKASRTIPARYPAYTIQYGGENKDTDESLNSLFAAFGVGAFVIFMILASLFRSLVQPAVVMVSIPFALIGVIWGFFLHGHPLSFLSIMGIVGLAGVVVNDSIVLVDFANRIRDENPEMGSIEIVTQAASMRLRAVMLTTLTTVLGLLPTAYGLGGYDPFLVPMALSFAWGLMFSTVLVLGLVPILYSIVMDTQQRLGWRKIASVD